MDTITAGKIIDRAILLEEGGVIVIPCSSYEEMEKLRTRLYKIRKQLERQHKELAFSLDITRKARKDKWTLYVTKDTGLSGVFVIEAGEATPFGIKDKPEKEEVKEIEEIKEEVEDFDEVAAKIEAAQDLEEEEEISKASKGEAWDERENVKNNIS